MFITLIFFSCNENKRTKKAGNIQQKKIEILEPVKDTLLAIGQIHSRVFCKNDTSLSYALFIPGSYSVPRKSPVIYLFDSHGDGLLPVEKYKSLAEKYHFILAGSNNSKNGLPPEKNRQIIKALFDDTQAKFSIDPKRIYTGGFSGGARVANSIALSGGIAGVVSCGAGFPANNEINKINFVFVGMAGNSDFNLIELKNIDRSLENSAVAHQLLIFDGKHEWPPAETMEEAFQSFEISAMKTGMSVKNDSLIRAYIEKKEKDILKLKNKNQRVEYWNQLRKLSSAMYGLADIEKYKTEIIDIERSGNLLPDLKIEMDAEKAEIEKQNEYKNALSSKNSDWWKKEIAMLKNEKSLKSKRLLGYLGLISYMYSSGALNQNLFPQADNFLKIYALIEPQNPEHQYLRAQLFMKTNEPEKALLSLKSALALGFKDKQRLEGDEVFSSLKKGKEYREIEILLSER